MTRKDSQSIIISAMVSVVAIGYFATTQLARGEEAGSEVPELVAEPDPFAKGGKSDPGTKTVKFPATETKKGLQDASGKALTVVNFEDANIEGQVMRPDGFVLQKRDELGLGATVELRRNFRDRIRASADLGLLVVPASP